MLVLFLTVFIDLVGFGVIIPLLPFFAEHYQATPDVVALVMATYSLFQFIAAPMWGLWSDRLGRRPILLISLAGASACYLLLGLSDSLVMLFIARALGGAMAGNIATAFAYMADITTPENRARGMGLIGAAFGLGFIVGPAIGGILAGADPHHANFAVPAFVASGLSAAAFLYALVRLKESLPIEVRNRLASRPRLNRWAMFLHALRRPKVGLAILVSFLATFVFAGMESTFAMWSERQFHWGPQQNGYLFAFVGLLSAAIQGGLIHRLAKRHGEARLVVQGTAALGLGMVLIPFAGSLPLLLLAMAIVAYGFAISTPSLSSLISLAIGEEERGAVMGVSRSMTTLARVVGPAFAGTLFAALGRNWPFYSGAVVMGAVVALSLVMRRRFAETPAG